MERHHSDHRDHRDHGTKAPVSAGDMHDCIGCIAPLDGLQAVVPDRYAVRDTLRPGLAPQLADAGAVPDTPPPRS
ncbi:MAG: hypothetical protein IE933_08700 [Sphingomonadales bacterium]|nr:hypothetical protein [Sphingomonadales bacterium]MBD3774776.1 hypothetical protein [Paracoccaceae bacterium]